MTKKQDLIVIGGGPGGLIVASVAAQVGLKVTYALAGRWPSNRIPRF